MVNNFSGVTFPAIQNGDTFNILFASGLEGAKQFPVPAGKKAVIFDSTPDAQVFYLKDTTNSTKPVRVFEYTEQEIPDEAQELNSLKQEVADLKQLVASLVKPLQELMGTPGKENSNE